MFFDLEKAYDTTWRYGILKALHACGVCGELAFFVKGFLNHRRFQVKTGNVLSDIKCQEEGVPQGCVLRVTLVALAINDMSAVFPHNALGTLFVDDLSISFSASNMATAEREIQLCVNKVVEWADNYGSKFSTS